MGPIKVRVLHCQSEQLTDSLVNDGRQVKDHCVWHVALRRQGEEELSETATGCYHVKDIVEWMT